MEKLLKNKSCFALLAAAWLFSPLASMAQSAGNSQLMSSGVMNKFSASDVTAMLSDYQIQAALQTYDGTGMANMIATTSGGAQFIITLFQCDDVATAQGCTTALIFTAMSNAGVSYDDLNTFHTMADVTRAVHISEQQIILFGTQIFSHGGIGRENFKHLTALFLLDMQGYLERLQAGASTVSLKAAPSMEKGGKISNSAETPAPLAEGFHAANIEHALSAAVSNTLRISFKPVETPAPAN